MQKREREGLQAEVKERKISYDKFMGSGQHPSRFALFSLSLSLSLSLSPLLSSPTHRIAESTGGKGRGVST